MIITMRSRSKKVLHRVALPVAVVLLVALASCTSAPAQAPAQPSTSGAHDTTQGQQQLVTTKETDWSGVSQALGRSGKLTDTVCPVPLARSDLAVSSQGVAIKPGLSLGGPACSSCTLGWR
jgi:hypothetical protein